MPANATKGIFSSFPYAALADERTQSWPLVASPWNTLTLLALYLLMVRYGPRWMDEIKAFKLKAPLFCYSMFMALLNCYIFVEVCISARNLKYSFSCQPCHVSYDTNELRLAAAAWWFYITKLLEFIDTMFFILRKKWTQLSFLHIYHHSTMFVICWIIIKWLPTGSIFFPVAINSFIHIIMYTYYALSALGPSMQRFLWWKRYLTIVQLIQFTTGVVWSLQAIIKKCEFQPLLTYIALAYMLSFLYLFGRFYAQKYFKASNKIN